MRTTRKKLPFGIGQIGKSFRNEITPGNFIFRIREFEQMELEFFCMPGEDLEWFAYWKEYCTNFLYSIGLKKESISLRDHEKAELSHYSNATTDIEFRYPFGVKELWGIADRTDFDLKAHSSHSGEALEYMDPTTGKKVVPYCIEPSVGVDRLTLALLCDAYDEQEPAAEELYTKLSADFNVDYDLSGSIGKRYRRQDEVGTPFCITVDFDTLEDGTVTVRDRDTMEQVRIHQDELPAFLAEKLEF